MYLYKLPLKFIGLWVLNLALLLTLSLTTGFHETLLTFVRTMKDMVTLYCVAGAVLALLEQALWNKLKGA